MTGSTCVTELAEPSVVFLAPQPLYVGQSFRSVAFLAG